MDKAQYKALFNETIKTWRMEGKRFNLDDALYEAELAEIAKERHARNGNGSNGSAPERVRCWCDESKINGRRVAVHRPEDCAYVAARSALVYEAAKIATQRIGDPTDSAAKGRAWSCAFSLEMNRLAAPLLRQ